MRSLADYLHEELGRVLDYQVLERALRHAQKRVQEDEDAAQLSEIEVACADSKARNAVRKPPPVMVVAQVALWMSTVEQTPVTPEDLVGRARHAHVAAARQIAMYAVKELCGLSSIEVGKIFDRDHSTVLHAVRQVQNLDHSDMLGFIRAQLVLATGHDVR